MSSDQQSHEQMLGDEMAAHHNKFDIVKYINLCECYSVICLQLEIIIKVGNNAEICVE